MVARKQGRATGARAAPTWPDARRGGRVRSVACASWTMFPSR